MFQTDREFEDEVRRIARLLWPSAQFDGAAHEDGRERDGIFETPDFVHVLECTVSRAKEKAREDATKIGKLIRRLGTRHPTKFVKGWFITLDEPTADQRTEVKSAAAKEKMQPAQVVALSFDQFRAQLVDARSYLEHRKRFPFGSVRNPTTGESTYELDYVPLQFLDSAGNSYDVDSVTEHLLSGQSFVLLGDYGPGKSATMRELFFRLASRFWRNKSLAFPILLNLRDHHGQTDPVEALERHARRVGFESPSALVRAWRGGFGILLLDGFDEIAAAGWAGKTRTLKELRYRSMELVRAFVRDTPLGVGYVVSGRAHFFDSENELRTALGIRSSIRMLQIEEFGEEQVTRFLGRLGWSETIPSWLPSRPLLLAYLASRNLLGPGMQSDSSADAASGWDELLDRIADREAEIEAGIDPDTVRRLIEHVAMRARNSVDGLGPISPDAMMAAFKDVCGYTPDDRGAVLLQRLPGLGAYHSEDGSRVFIDRDFAEAARGGATFRIIENPYNLEFDSETWQNALLPLGAEVTAYRSDRLGYTAAKVCAAMRHVIDQDQAYTIAADLVLVLAELGASCDGDSVYVREVIVPELRLEDLATDLHVVEFQDSVVGVLSLGADVRAERLPKFVRCHIGAIEGRTGPDDIPRARFVECEIGAFEESAQTTRGIMSLSLPRGTKVMLTVLKKLYAQSGSGRKASAFYRGLDTQAQALVDEVLSLLRREGLVTKSARGSQQIWLPTRTQDSRRRALAMLAAPNAPTDPVMAMSKTLG